MIEVQSNKTYTTLFGDHYNNLVVFGNPDTPKKFQNHMKMEFWGENYISFHNKGVKGTPSLDGDRLTLDTPEKTYYWEPKTQNQMRWVEVLKVKPASNKWSLKLSGHEEFNFNYQIPFAIRAQSMTGSSIESFKKDGEDWIRLVLPQEGLFFERPVRIDGSYAVKHKTKRDNILGHKNYRAGKVLHIPRPTATDAVGKSVLCSLHIENGIYTRITPQTFLDNAVYPVTINDDFGYWSSGASVGSSSGNYQMSAGPYSPASDGSATSITCYFTDMSTSLTLGMWNDNGGVPGTLKVDTPGDSSPTENAWNEQSFDAPEAILAASSYHFGFNSATGANTRWAYDDDGTSTAWYDVDTYVEGTLQDHDPTEWYTTVDFSAYVTYTPSAVGAIPKGPLGHPLHGVLAGPISF